MPLSNIQILLTNDDGIDSPGLWAAADSLSKIGKVWVVAPKDQSTGAGRSLPSSSKGIIIKKQVTYNDKEWIAYSVDGTPAQAIQHGLLEILPGKPDLVVSGINYGLNLGTGITISGTVGAAMESASSGIPSIAVSLETPKKYHLSYSSDINFKDAGEITKYFAEQYLKLPNINFDLLKIDIPLNANANTDWEVTHLSKKRYYKPIKPKRESWDIPENPGYEGTEDLELFSKESDVYTVLAKNKISITPINLDMTANVDFIELQSNFTG